MNLRNEIVLEIIKNDIPFRFHVQVPVTYEECHNALVDFANKIVELAKEEQERQKAASTEQEAQHGSPQ